MDVDVATSEVDAEWAAGEGDGLGGREASTDGGHVAFSLLFVRL